ncbi:MAG: DUF1906 domain-containing protein [Chloroflexi bacterium]|nr:DUF1906 domain-containing protein [Chloroflexota bacterium]
MKKQHVRSFIVMLVVIATALLNNSFPVSVQGGTPRAVGLVDGPNMTDLEFQLVSPSEGWILFDKHLHWTRTGGADWTEITPPDLEQSVIRAVAFPDMQHGWLILSDSDELGVITYTMARTFDTGKTWQITPLSQFQPGDMSALASAVYLRFIDTQTGWLVIEQATSSNFSVGALFKTSDGGDSWTQLSIPIGEPVYFVTSEVGWTAGGPAGDELYHTQDGGHTWQPQTLAAEGDRRLFYQLPTFENARTGVLPVIVVDGDQTKVEFYVTSDGGRSWSINTSVPINGELDPATRIPLTTFDTHHTVMIAPNSGHMLSLSDQDETTIVTVPDHLAAGISELDMATPTVGWAKYTSGNCTPVTQTRCTLETQLLRTSDGGQSWMVLDLPQTGRVSADSVTESSEPSDVDSTRSLGSQTQAFVGQGFDKCEIASLNQLQNWMTHSPYKAVNLYIGGSSRACANTGLTASLVSQASLQGWKFIPTWVGPQAACSGYSSRMSYDSTTAYNQGVSEANAAINAAANLGLTLADKSGTIIYYDLEVYDTTNVACHNAAKSFVSGWSSQIRAWNSQAGIYGYGPAINSFASIDNAPDAIWPAHWIHSSYNSGATVWSVYGLSNNLWKNHQRIRQYAGGHNETWGSTTLNIDCNVIDGIVAVLDQSPTNRYVGKFDNPAYGGGPVVIDMRIGDSTVSGYINFSNKSGNSALCGAGSFSGTRNGNSIQFSFTSDDPDYGCGADKGLVFNVSGTLSGDQITGGTYTVGSGESGTFSASRTAQYSGRFNNPEYGSGEVVLDIVIGASSVVGYTDFTNDPGHSALCGAGPFVGTKNGNSIQFKFTSNDSDSGCGFDYGQVFDIDGTLSANQIAGSYSVDNGESGTFSVSTPDDIEPDGNITSPSNASTVGSTVNLSATAEDNTDGSGINRVEFWIKYNREWHWIGKDTTSPYSIQWSAPSGLKSQLLRFAIHVFDNAGNEAIDPGGYRYAYFFASQDNPTISENWVPSDRRAYLNQRSLTPDGNIKCGAASTAMMLAMNGKIGRDYDSMASTANAIYIKWNPLWWLAKKMRERGMTAQTTCATSNNAWNTIKSEVNAGRPVLVLSNRFTKGHYFVAVGYRENGSDRQIIVYDPYGRWTGSYRSYDRNSTSSSSRKGKWVYYDFSKAWGYSSSSCTNGRGWMLTARPQAMDMMGMLSDTLPATPPDEFSDEPEDIGTFEGVEVIAEHVVYLPLILR